MQLKARGSSEGNQHGEEMGRRKKPAPQAAALPGRGRRSALFPAASFEEALTIANAIQKHAAGQRIRRLTLFDQMGKSPDSGPSRQLIVNSSRFELTRGGYHAEFLELTPEGKLATAPDAPAREAKGAIQIGC